MSLTMMALRIAAVEALKAGNTLVGNNVLDSQISAINQTADGGLQTDQQRPFIAVYTDSAKSGDLANTGLRSNGSVELVFNCGVALTMAETNKDTGESELIAGLPATDAHFEALLDALGCQICRVLTDSENPWAQVFGDLGVIQSKSQVKSSSAADNVRLACGQIKLMVEAYADPAYGATFPDDSHWARFLVLMEANDIGQLGLFQLLLGQPESDAYPDYEALTGMTAQDAKSLRLYSYGGLPADTEIASAATETGQP